MSNMSEAWYALAPAGNGCWSNRSYDALMRGAIPVLLATPMVLPFDKFLSWADFSHNIDLDGGPEHAFATLASLHHKLYTSEGRQREIAMLHQGRAVRRWFTYPQNGSLYSAVGLMLLELFVRRSAYE